MNEKPVVHVMELKEDNLRKTLDFMLDEMDMNKFLSNAQDIIKTAKQARDAKSDNERMESLLKCAYSMINFAVFAEKDLKKIAELGEPRYLTNDDLCDDKRAFIKECLAKKQHLAIKVEEN